MSIRRPIRRERDRRQLSIGQSIATIPSITAGVSISLSGDYYFELSQPLLDDDPILVTVVQATAGTPETLTEFPSLATRSGLGYIGVSGATLTTGVAIIVGQWNTGIPTMPRPNITGGVLTVCSFPFVNPI